MERYLEVEVSPGMLAGERAIRVRLASSYVVSFFLDADRIKEDAWGRKFIAVNELEVKDGASLVRLPCEPMEAPYGSVVAVPRTRISHQVLE